MTLFELAAVLTLNKSSFDQGISQAEGQAEGFGSKLKSGLGTAAKTAGVAVAALGTAAVATTKTLLDGAAEAAVYGDNIDKMSQKMGLSAEAYQEWDAIMQHSGTSIESLQAGMKTLANAVESGNGAFERLGISQEMIAEMNNEELFSATISALQNVENETERTYLAGQLLGRGATELGALLNTSAEDTEAMRQRVHELGGVMSDEAVKAAAAFQDSLQDMTTAFDGVKRNITSEFLPSITTIMDAVTSISIGEDGGFGELSKGISGFVSTLTDMTPRVLEIGSNIVESLVKATAQNAPKVAKAAVNVVKQLSRGLSDNIPMLAKSAIEIGNVLIDGVGEMLPEFVAGGLQVVQSLAQGISENIGSITETVVQAVSDIALMITDPETLTGILQSGLTIVTSLAQGILEAIPTLIESLPLVIDNIVTFILDSIPLIIDTGTQLLTSLVSNIDTIVNSILSVVPTIISNLINSIIGAIPQIVESGVKLLVSLVQNLPTIITNIVKVIPTLISGIAEGILGNIDKIILAGVQLFVSLIENLPTIIVEIVKAVPQIVTGIVEAFGSLLYKFVEIGGNLISGLWEGIQSAGDWLGEKVSGFFGGLVDNVKDFLGIHSPSTVFAGIGENMALGVGEGFSDEFKDIKDDINGQMDFSGSANFDLNRDISTSYSGAESVYSASRNNAAVETRERQPLIVVVQLESDLELARALIEDINNAKRIDGYAY